MSMVMTVAAPACDCPVWAEDSPTGELVWSYVADHGLLDIGPACGLNELGELEALLASEELWIELEEDGEPVPYIESQEGTQDSWSRVPTA